MDEALPSYNESTNSADAKILLPPITLTLDGQIIYGGENRNAGPLYRLSRSIKDFVDNARDVTFEKVDHHIRTLHDGTSQMTMRYREMYHLKHPTKITGPTFLYYAESTSKLSLGSFGLSSFRRRRVLSSRNGYNVHRAERRLDHKLDVGGKLFSGVATNGKAVAFEWSDGQGNIVAREVKAQPGRLPTLLITKEMKVRRRDALAAAWILKLWWETAGSESYEL